MEQKPGQTRLALAVVASALAVLGVVVVYSMITNPVNNQSKEALGALIVLATLVVQKYFGI